MSNITLPCDNCDRDYNPTASRWRCPYCGFKTSCCEGDSGESTAQGRDCSVQVQGTGCGVCGGDCRCVKGS